MHYCFTNGDTGNFWTGLTENAICKNKKTVGNSRILKCDAAESDQMFKSVKEESAAWRLLHMPETVIIVMAVQTLTLEINLLLMLLPSAAV